MEANWQKFIHVAQSKSEAHSRSASYWDRVHNILSLTLIFLGAITTALALLHSVPIIVVASMSGITTLISTASAFLRPSEKRQTQVRMDCLFVMFLLHFIKTIQLSIQKQEGQFRRNCATCWSQ